MNKTSLPTDFEPGPLLSDTPKLTAFLQQCTAGTWLQFPVIIRYADDFPPSVERAVMGLDPENEPSNPVVLDLDDTRMGISLATHCEGETVCVQWVKGTWPAESNDEGAWRFYLRGVSEDSPEPNAPARIYSAP